MGQRQKKKNMLRSKEKLERRIRELESIIKQKDCMIKDRAFDIERLLDEIQRLTMRLHTFGTMPVYKELYPVGNDVSEIEAQTLTMQPIPWGTYRIVEEKELEKILNEKKKWPKIWRRLFWTTGWLKSSSIRQRIIKNLSGGRR